VLKFYDSFEEKNEIIMNATNLSSQQWRSMIALNNISCALLEKNCHRQAQQTLQETIVIIKLLNATTDQKPSDHVAVDESLKSLHNTLCKAETRLSNPIESQVHMPVTAYSVDVHSPSFRSILTTVESSAKAYHSIRVEISESVNLEDLDSDVLFAITIFNLAVARLSLAKINESTHLMESAIKMLRLANNLLALSENQIQVLFVAIANLDTMASALNECGNLEEADIYVSKLAELKLAAKDYASIEEIGIPGAACAA
jgi:hypothetical protein